MLEDVPSPEISSIVPDTAFSMVKTPATIRGRNLFGELGGRVDKEAPTSNRSFTVLIGDTQVPSADIVFVDTETINILVPIGLALGVHDVAVNTPGNRRATLVRGLTIMNGTATGTSCETDAECEGPCHSVFMCIERRCVVGNVDKDTDQDGFLDIACPGGTDCDDTSSAIKPGAVETVANGIDEDCDGVDSCYEDLDDDGVGSTNIVDDTDLMCTNSSALTSDTNTDCDDDAITGGGCSASCPTFYRDADGDTYGTDLTTVSRCTAPAGYVGDSSDCDDTSSAIKPGAVETVANGIDEDCDGVDSCYEDLDDDGVGSTNIVDDTDLTCTNSSALTSDANTDCDDDAITGGGCSASCPTFYRDADEDAYGTDLTTVSRCTAPAGYVDDSTDCDDTSSAIKPGAVEGPSGNPTCFDTKDNDCNGLADRDDLTCKRLYRSVGTRTSNLNIADRKVTISGSNATFDGEIPPNIGVGDVLEYQDQQEPPNTYLAFISGRISAYQYDIQSRNGRPPPLECENNTVAVYRAYASLANCADQNPNATIDDSVEADARFPSQDLVGDDTIAMVSCYADSVDTAAVTVSGAVWTTGVNNFIQIYTPTKIVQVGESQRHTGKWDTSAYRLEVRNGDGINMTAGHVRIEGLQVWLSSVNSDNQKAIEFQSPASDADLRVSHSIVRGPGVVSATWCSGIVVYTAGMGEARIWNNITYNFNADSGSENAGIECFDSEFTYWVHNNTAYGNRVGIGQWPDAAVFAKNNLSYANNQNYFGIFDAASTNNLSGPTGSAPDQNPRNDTPVFFANETGDDFRLNGSDSGARNFGVNLATDSSLAFADDINGEPRPQGSSWDIGADEVGDCGDSVLEPSEGCDDGNLLGGDGCNPNCDVEVGARCNLADPGKLGSASCASEYCDPAVGFCAARACVPVTGQTTPYEVGDDGTYQKGVPWPSPRFVDNGVTMTDYLTGLVWEKKPGGGDSGAGDAAEMYWADAITYCETLGLAPTGGAWRLPNINEIKSLERIEGYSPSWLQNQGFTSVESRCWSSTTVEETRGAAQIFDFDTVALSTADKMTAQDRNFAWAVRNAASHGFVWLPRTGQETCYDGAGAVVDCASAGQDATYQAGAPWPSPRFVNNGNGTVTDNLTGLIWERAPTGAAGTWTAALSYCENLNLAGYSDWRLPNEKELSSLAHWGKISIADWLNTQGFVDVLGTTYSYWSSSTYPAVASKALTFRMSNGRLGEANKSSSTFYAWAVRGGVVSAVGLTAIGSEPWSQSVRMVEHVTIPEAGTIQSITVYHDAGSGGIQLAIYSIDGSDNVSTRLTDVVSGTVSGTPEWQTFNLVSPLYVAAGQKIGLAYVPEYPLSVRYNNSGGRNQESPETWPGGLPMSWGAISATYSSQSSIYATLTQ
ncbi:DUF1566 domain-containing protein [Myxococcota bacterium]